GMPSFATTLDSELQEYLTLSNVEWTWLSESAHFAAEAEWRSIFGHVFRGRPRLKRGAKAEYEFLQEPCTHFLIVPFTSDVEGTPMHVYRKSISAYECHGALLRLGEFCDAEFFVSPLDLEWTMVHTHEDHAIDGPYFIRREWVS